MFARSSDSYVTVAYLGEKRLQSHSLGAGATFALYKTKSHEEIFPVQVVIRHLKAICLSAPCV